MAPTVGRGEGGELQEVREVVALKDDGGFGCSVVTRVRDLLETCLASSVDGPEGRARCGPVRAREIGAADRDLAEVESRLRRLHALCPDLRGVELGPLVEPARELVAHRHLALVRSEAAGVDGRMAARGCAERRGSAVSACGGGTG